MFAEKKKKEYTAFLLKFLIYNFPTASKNGQRLSKK